MHPFDVANPLLPGSLNPVWPLVLLGGLLLELLIAILVIAVGTRIGAGSAIRRFVARNPTLVAGAADRLTAQQVAAAVTAGVREGLATQPQGVAAAGGGPGGLSEADRQAIAQAVYQALVWHDQQRDQQRAPDPR